MLNNFSLLFNIVLDFNLVFGQSLGIVVSLLLSVAYFTLAKKKLIAPIKKYKKPNVMGYFDLLQPLADGLKLLVKENLCPSNAKMILFFIIPILTFILSFIGWVVIPFGPHAVFMMGYLIKV